jgi:N-methylhydantoinase A/oxoprolinase/acetone carboxylase beta subunit
MSKKSFKKGFDALLEIDLPEDDIRHNIKSPAKPSESRSTFIVEDRILENIKAISYWERAKIKTIVNKALHQYIEEYVAQKGPIQLPPAE